MSYYQDLVDSFKMDFDEEDMKNKEVKQLWREIQKIGRYSKTIEKIIEKSEIGYEVLRYFRCPRILR